jgi:hypothetical protein
MSIRRRHLLAVAGGAAVAAAVAPAPAAAATHYLANRAPLRQAAFLRLPPGAVRAQGWLSTQLARQVTGLNGRLADISHYLRYENTGWTNPALGGWEEVPYWLRGYVDLGYVTGDATVLATARRWMDGVLGTQAADGYFGPSALRTALGGHPDLWPHMPMLAALRSHAEYTGDGRVEGFLGRFFRYVNAQPAAVFRDGWGTWRWGDTIDVVYWLYNRTGEAFLLDLVRRIHANSADWRHGLPNLHNVNVTQGFREPAQYWVLSGVDADRAATYGLYDTIQRDYGQFPGGGFAGDENMRPGLVDPRQGFETCGIVEYMLSHEILTRITGDPVWGDRTEELAFNSLPAALDPAGRAVHYVTSANSVDLDNVPKTQGQFSNAFEMQSYRPGIDRYRCCPHNYGMGWPYYVEEMWLATPDGGLCAALLGPSTVTARVGTGVTVTVTEETGYPFTDTVAFRLRTPSAVGFAFSVRVPGWCLDPELRINGAVVAAGPGPRYATVHRTWQDGDTVTLRLPMRPVVRTWPRQHNAASVHYGALAFSLRVAESWVRTGGTDQFPEYDVHAGSPWNYGLVPGSAIAVAGGGSLTDPFTTANAPVRLSTSGQRIAAWQADQQRVVAALQDGPVASTAPVEQVTLIPMGAARLRVTTFPQTGGTRAWQRPGAAFRICNKHSGKVLGVDGMSVHDSANVVQFADSGTADHLWRIADAGGGFVKLQCANSGKVLAVEGMSSANSARIQQFADVGSADQRWQLVDSGDGHLRLRNAASGKVLGVAGMSTADSAQVVQFDDNGTADHEWRLVPDGPVKILNGHSGKVLAVEGMSTVNSARVQQYADTGTPDHVWSFVPSGDGWYRIRNQHSGKVLAVAGMSTADSAQVVQFDDNGSADQQWRLRVVAGGPGTVRIQNRHSGKVLAVHDMSTLDSANVEQYQDSASPDHHWSIL